MRLLSPASLMDRFLTKLHQVWLTASWTMELSKRSKAVLIVFILASTVNALTDGFTVMLVVPILNASNAEDMFQGIPLLSQFGALFAGMDAVTRLRWIALMILVIVVLRGVIGYFVDIIIYYIPISIDQNLRIRAFRTISAARMSYVDSLDIGDLTNYTASFPARVGIAARFLAQMISSALTIMLMLVLLLTITPGSLVAIGIFSVVASLVFKWLTNRYVLEVSRGLTAGQERFNQVYYEAIGNRKPIKLFRAGDLFASRIYEAINELRRVQIRTLALQAATYPFFSTFAGIVVCISIFAASALQPDRAQGLLGIMVVGLVLLFRLIGPLTIFHIARMNFVPHVEALESLHRFFQIADAAEDRDGTIALGQLRGHIEFENVSFAYDAARPVLSNLSFTAQPGEIVALVGRSGVGKTTIFYLLARIYRPTSGRILIDGVDLNDIKIETWWRAMSLVGQDAPIFMGSVKENISFGREVPDTDEAYHRALDAAAAREFVAALPHQLNSQIGDGKQTLSGGERQRIALARAFYAQPQVVLLDEATSQIDSLAEKRIREEIAQLRRNGGTTIVIAHRLSTVQNADKIVVVDRGGVDAVGSFQQLVARGGLFARLVESQLIESR